MLKVLVSANGIYRIKPSDLQATGLPVDRLDFRKASLTLLGRPVPVWLEQETGDWNIYFYGQSTSSLYTADNVYVLQFSEQPPDLMSTITIQSGGNPSGSQTLQTYTAIQRTEQQLIYSPPVKEGDHWFWATVSAPKSQDFEITLTQLAPDPQHLDHIIVSLYGSTEASQDPDHHARVLVNGHQVIEDRWDGQGWHTLEGEIPGEVLKEGINQVTVNLPGDTGAPADVVLMNWIELDYTRNLVAENDRLEFNSSGQPQKLVGFKGPVEVFDISDPDHVQRWPAAFSPKENSLVFQGEQGHRYLALGPQGILSPVRVTAAVTTPDLKASTGSTPKGADYIAIGPSDLLAPLEPLLTWRQKQGLKVMEVPLDAIYDQFNYGLPEPEAIRSFLNYAHLNWQPAPRYVLLVGDATFDPRGYAAPAEANRLPTFFVQTGFGGETASDVVFSQAGLGTPPQVALGRVPARQPEQVKVFVDKVLSYEQSSPPAEWRSRVLAVADGQAANFQQDARSFLDQLPQNTSKDLYSPPAGVQDAAQVVASYFSDGRLLVAYFGHGSVNMWGKDRIFSTNEVQSLTNQKAFPIVFSFTCLNGLFTHPKVDSMAEALLFQPGGGAVSVMAPTSLTLPADQSFFEDALVENLVKRPALSLGEVFLAAQKQVSTENPDSSDVLETFLLFGDPALHIAWPDQ